ncbi:hypothetical protein Hanom_Chr02g00174131 [Helianthus anomalus]
MCLAVVWICGFDVALTMFIVSIVCLVYVCVYDGMLFRLVFEGSFTPQPMAESSGYGTERNRLSRSFHNN